MPAVNATFTLDTRRIAVLQRNYDLGVARELIEASQREKLHAQLLNVTRQHVIEIDKQVLERKFQKKKQGCDLVEILCKGKIVVFGASLPFLLVLSCGANFHTAEGE